MEKLSPREQLLFDEIKSISDGDEKTIRTYASAIMVPGNDTKRCLGKG